MAAIDTIASYQGTVGSTLAAGTAVAGSSATIRSFPSTARARLLAAMSDHVTSVQPWRIRSPYLHDISHGISFWPGETPSKQLLPRAIPQDLRTQDTLTFEFSTAAATGKALGALSVYYDQLPGINARLFAPGDISGIVEAIKILEVTIASGSNTAGVWYDALITATEDLLKGDTDYAVLGYATDVAVAAVALYGSDTGNLRIAGPGVVGGNVTADYFTWLSERAGVPCIPVINSANKGSTNVSILSAAATAADMHLQLILGELSHKIG